MTGLDKAILKAGSQYKLARLIGVTPQTLNRWVLRYKGVMPPKRVIPIFEATGITPHELRPDIHPTPTSGIPDGVTLPPTTEGCMNNGDQA
ncbi:transcriptional regulator [Yokenella regensburgei]|uniref:transcriptional regulator n=1 Tax=Yokenella regensburgei TaxID=158877 RepID=UPI003EDACB47